MVHSRYQHVRIPIRLLIYIIQAELKLSIPEVPTVFLKANACLNSPAGHIVAPHHADRHDCHLDYEVELAVVLGEPVRTFRKKMRCTMCWAI